MGLMRAALLRGSESRWLERQFRQRAFAKKAVSRFMPGEEPEDALRVAASLEANGIETIVTCLGENVVTEEDAKGVHGHYHSVVRQIREHGLRTRNCLSSQRLSEPTGRSGDLGAVERVA